MKFIQERSENIVITVLVQPRSSKNMIAGIHGDAVKIKLTAPPIDNAANRMCIEFLSKCLSLPKSYFEIISGKSARKKKIRIRCQDDASAQAIIDMIRQLTA
jgi:uncharacterized protein (TIGR00251 family)